MEAHSEVAVGQAVTEAAEVQDERAEAQDCPFEAHDCPSPGPYWPPGPYCAAARATRVEAAKVVFIVAVVFVL
jgi:hypothetical protein